VARLRLQRAMRPPVSIRVARNRRPGARMPRVELCVWYSPSTASVESTSTLTRVRRPELSRDTPRTPIGNRVLARRPKSSASELVRSILKNKMTGTNDATTDLNVRTEPTESSSVNGAVRPIAIRDCRVDRHRFPQVKSLSGVRAGWRHHNPQGRALDCMTSDFTVGSETASGPTMGTSLSTATAALPNEDSKNCRFATHP
jgi:hypothetical protein